MDYYEVLGVDRDADQKAIKKAYFRLVRQYSPEKDPERFQQIREAYENLTAAEGGQEKEGLMRQFPADPMGDWMREEIVTLMRYRDYKGAMKVAERGIDHYGEMEGFLYFLAICQIRAGNTGKAAKNFERLIQLFPEKSVYKRRLAMAYYERGYGKKAYEAFGKAYEEGCKDYDFLNMYAMCCRDRGKSAQGVAILKEATRLLEKTPGWDLYELLDNFGGILLMAAAGDDKGFAEAAESFERFLTKNQAGLREYTEDVLQVFAALIWQCKPQSKFQITMDLVQRAEAILAPEKGRERDAFREDWKLLKQEIEYRRLEGDPRLTDVMAEAYEAFVKSHKDSSIARYILRDTQLCVLEEWPKIKAQFEIVKKEYPIFWEKLKDFAYTLEHTQDLERLRQQYQKDYDRREKFISGGYYYERYPHRRQVQMAVQWSGEDGTYTRSQPKVGRNDPCPCGSGKKYKNCCGRK